jgi:hypothetical protein
LLICGEFARLHLLQGKCKFKTVDTLFKTRKEESMATEALCGGVDRKKYLHMVIDAGVHTDKEVGDLAGVSHQTVATFRRGDLSTPETTVAILGALLAATAKGIK